jgi:hypothetical protein
MLIVTFLLVVGAALLFAFFVWKITWAQYMFLGISLFTNVLLTTALIQARRKS